VRVPRAVYQLDAAIGGRLPGLRPAQRRGLTRWVSGAGLAGAAGQPAVLAALLPLAGAHAVRQRRREWLADGVDKAAPGRGQVDVAACFAPLRRWVVAWWPGTDRALAVDATSLGDRVVVLAVSGLDRGSAIPVAWHVVPAQAPGEWLPHVVARLGRLAPAVPAGWTVLVLADRGRWRPRRWGAIRAHGWHPLRRLQRQARCRPVGRRRWRRADALVPGPGHAWVGAGHAFTGPRRRRAGPLVVAWEAEQAAPWVVLADLAPTEVGPCWYGRRAWIELGFRALKGVGWQWDKTRRTDPARVARHWLVLAVATLWGLAYGPRAEDAALRGVPPAHRRLAAPPPPPDHRRTLSVFARGLGGRRRQVLRQRRRWTRRWLVPDAWPRPAPALVVTRVPTPLEPLHV